MKNKIIGIAIIGIVLSISFATLAKYLDQKYIDYCIENVEKHDKILLKYYQAHGVYPRPIQYYTYNLIHPFDVYSIFLFTGLTLTVIVILKNLKLPKIYHYMTYSFITTIILGIIFIINNGQGDITIGNYNINRITFDKEPYLKNSIYFGLGISVLIFGLKLVNTKQKV